ncbi:MAG: methyltransferase domain-containing protein [Betaproteobacteria bacterium]|jgi:malonyl-CoA O-methyltransferase|nr:methyltransferase domain-containing protein [Betaproteobacteria bacterium]
MPAPAPCWLDRDAVRRANARARRRGAFRDPLADEIGRRMLERLEYIKLTPRRVVDVGGDAAGLCMRYPGATAISVGFAPASLGTDRRIGWRARIRHLFAPRLPCRLVADAERLPLASQSCDLVWSNLALAHSDDPGAVLHEWSRVMATDGLLMFSSLGPDTLKELRSAFADDPQPHVHPFVDMHDLGDMLVAAGFADPVMDMEVVTFTYPRFEELIAELRASGQINSLAARRRGLTGRRIWDRARRAYAQRMREGRVPASFEIVYGHAWKPRPRVAADGRQIIKFDRAASGR